MGFSEEKLREAQERYKALYGGCINPKKSWWFRITRKRWIDDWKGLKPIQRAIILSLWLYAGKKNTCYPSERKIAEDLNTSLKTIWRNIRILENRGFIQINKKIGSKGKYHEYKLLK
ncbi:helix-turn-helix domain-containing protein [Patescibacteria group bacterium]